MERAMELLWRQPHHSQKDDVVNDKTDEVFKLHRAIREWMFPIRPTNGPCSDHRRYGLSSPPGLNAVPHHRWHHSEEDRKPASPHAPGQSTDHGVSDVVRTTRPLLEDTVNERGRQGREGPFDRSWPQRKLTPHRMHMVTSTMGLRIPAASACLALKP